MFIEFFSAELKRRFQLWKSYPFQAVIGLSLSVGMFFAVLTGVNFFFNSEDETITSASITLTYFVWAIVLGGVNNTASTLEEEIKVGVLETIFLSKYGGARIILYRNIVDSISGLALTLTLLFILVGISGAEIEITIPLILSLILLDISITGLSFIAGGITILVKKIDNILPLINFGLATLAATSMSQSAGSLLNDQVWTPIISTLNLIREIGLNKAEPTINSFLIAATGAFLVYVLGYLFLKRFIKLSKKYGSLAHY